MQYIKIYLLIMHFLDRLGKSKIRKIRKLKKVEYSLT